jgi:Holliday junction DNA helicase RuvA
VIGYLEGTLLKKYEDRILLLVNQVGYEVLLPAVVMETMKSKTVGDVLSLYVYFQQTERQPKPVLIGFNLEAEKEFFQYFISVEDVGPLKAVRALNISIPEIAWAIENDDVARLTQLKGIGNRTAHKIIATLKGRMQKFALISRAEEAELAIEEDIAEQVIDVLVAQLGHKISDAKRMVADALSRNSSVDTPEALFEEVYRGEVKPE